MKGGIDLLRKIFNGDCFLSTSICYVFEEKIVKTTNTEELGVNTNLETCNIQLGS